MTSCIDIITKFSDIVDKENNHLVDKMTDPDMKYNWVCVKPDVTYDTYFEHIQTEFDSLVNKLINSPDKCGSITNLLPMFDLINSMKGENLNLSQDELLKRLEAKGIEFVKGQLLSLPTQPYKTDADPLVTLKNFLTMYASNCSCQTIDIFKLLLEKYKGRLQQNLAGLSDAEITNLIKTNYDQLKTVLNTTKVSDLDKHINGIIQSISPQVITATPQTGGSINWSLESELNNLIPDSLGKMKEFFITIITRYYNNLHPIIWCQIVKYMIDEFPKVLPYTREEVFQFVSKCVLLTSGPFILKLLQMIRPALTPELAKKYNLTKLTYPLMTKTQVEIVLSKIMNNWGIYRIIRNVSASVGHVCLLFRVDKPKDIFVVKLIKPLSMAQSCAEYSVLYNLFPKDSCEANFVINTLKSNGRELNVTQEIENLRLGNEYYTADYKDVFGVENDAKLRVIKNIPGIIKDGVWSGLTMTLAPGLGLNKLIEDDLLMNDTKYRAGLHRCLDLLVCKFFQTLISKGYFHGDCHSGNLYYDGIHNTISMIDFGSVGNIDLFEGNEDINTFIKIIIMSMFYNYGQMFDTITELLNSKCGSEPIDMKSQVYQEFRKELVQYGINNVAKDELEKKKAERYLDDIFSNERLAVEKNSKIKPETEKVLMDSIYSYLEIDNRQPETIVENRDTLPQFTNITNDSENITFAKVIELCIKFYAKNSQSNISVALPNFNEIQKAYALLLGVLAKTGYSSYRMSMAIKKGIVNISNIGVLTNVSTVSKVVKYYWSESSKFTEIQKSLVAKGQMGGRKRELPCLY